MKKIGLLFKETSENRIKNSLKDSDSLFVINYSKLSSPDLTALRQSLKDTNAKLFVVKNCVARRALKDSGWNSLVGNIENPCGLVFIKDDPVSASKVLYDFARGHEPLKLLGGFLKDRVINAKDIESLSRLPSKGVLRAQVVMTLKSPITGLVMVLNGTLRKFVYCLEQIKNKKGN